MLRLKNKILKFSADKAQIDDTLNTLKKIQDNLIKNHSNPVFSSDDKNKLLQKYNAVGELGKSLYKYKNLSLNNMNIEADSEQETASDIVLKGGISNVRYVWHAENGTNTCKLCAELDGKVYDLEDDIPERPHPNCRCTVEIIDDEKTTNDTKTDEQPCDCWEQINFLIDKLETMISEVENLGAEFDMLQNTQEEIVVNINKNLTSYSEMLEILIEEYGKHLEDCPNNIDSFYEEILAKKEKLQEILDKILHLIQLTVAYIEVLAIFGYNFGVLLVQTYILKEEGMDKYRHSVANCQSAKLGDLQYAIAVAASDYKEKFDQYKNIYARTHKVSEEEAMADSERDQIANSLGRYRGSNFPTCSCKDLMWELRPKNKR